MHQTWAAIIGRNRVYWTNGQLVGVRRGNLIRWYRPAFDRKYQQTGTTRTAGRATLQRAA